MADIEIKFAFVSIEIPLTWAIEIVLPCERVPAIRPMLSVVAVSGSSADEVLVTAIIGTVRDVFVFIVMLLTLVLISFGATIPTFVS